MPSTGESHANVKTNCEQVVINFEGKKFIIDKSKFEAELAKNAEVVEETANN